MKFRIIRGRRWKRWVAGIGLLLIGGLLLYWEIQYRREHRFNHAILLASKRYGIPPALIKAVIWRESDFDPWARGKAGEIGLMQISDVVAGEWADTRHLNDFNDALFFNPTTNILAGTWYLAKLIKRYLHTDNPLPFALANYNAGRSRVLVWGRGIAATNSIAFFRRIRYPTTRNYIRTVLQHYVYYTSEFPPFTDTWLRPRSAASPSHRKVNRK